MELINWDFLLFKLTFKKLYVQVDIQKMEAYVRKLVGLLRNGNDKR